MTDARFEDTSQGPGGRPSGGGSRHRPPAAPREPMFNAPWPALVLVGAIIAAYAWQSTQAPEVVVPALGFSAAGLAAGRWETLFTALFLHAGWGHALMNAAFALAFASPTARLFGTGALGSLVFLVFYLLCGALSSLGFAAFHWGSPQLLVGASGAVSGLMGAAARITPGRHVLGGLLSRQVLGMGGAWLAVNLIIALIGGALLPGADGAAVAWEAHLAGFAAGVLLVGPFAWIARRG